MQGSGAGSDLWNSKHFKILFGEQLKIVKCITQKLQKSNASPSQSVPRLQAKSVVLNEATNNQREKGCT